MTATPARKATGILWEFLSVDELMITPDGKTMRKRAPGQQAEELDPDQTYVARLWRPSAQYTDMPDCEVHRVIRVAEEVLTLTQMVDAISRSRLSAGMLFVPDEITFNDIDEDEIAEQDDEPDPFTQALMEHMAAPIADRESAAALVPLVRARPGRVRRQDQADPVGPRPGHVGAVAPPGSPVPPRARVGRPTGDDDRARRRQPLGFASRSTPTSRQQAHRAAR